jgi:hypothetical protein
MPTPAGPDTNEFRCNACGRYFNTASELAGHEVECRLARVTTEAGRRDLEEEDRNPRPKNDHDSVERPFQHGRREEEVKR